MTLDALMAQVVSMRAQVEAMAATIDALRDHAPIQEPIGCRHPDLEQVGTFGAPAWRCRGCGAEGQGQAP